MLHLLDDGREPSLRLELELENEMRLPGTQRIIINKVEVKEPKPCNGILVNQDRSSVEAVQKWMELSKDVHSKIPDRPMEQKPPRLRLMDVNERRIIEVQSDSRYVCLSYVWGQIVQPQYTSATKVCSRHSMASPRSHSSSHRLLEIP
jgi:hypothetical protein